MILAVDLGQKTTGVAISEGNLASPYKTLKHQSAKEAIVKISKVCSEVGVEKLVVGYVEGKIKSFFENFAHNFKRTNPGIEVVLLDETMTTRQARQTLLQLQVPKTKRAKKEHEIAASIILQSYLDSL